MAKNCTVLKPNHIIVILSTFYYIYTHNFNQNLQNSALLISQHTYVYLTYFIVVCFKEMLVSVP